ncbi:beta-amylase 8 isoform X3 [Durio zibethinus]|uniref:Beta-amylase n=1 Tax=Durio zibethinus TaxID=66656 RepID=A0A6P5Y946_DURZI|nr:beta-amylase 8 isoform X3 [Durio zibethinus]
MQNPPSSTNVNLDPTMEPQPQPQPRRPRGFAATAAAAAASVSPTVTPSGTAAASTASSSGKGKREREKEKERTKLRERHRRAITSRMLAGLRQYGNFPLPARADMNDVLAALAREAGWTVEPDGTTYRHSLPPPQHQQHLGAFSARSGESPLSASSLKNCSVKATLDCQPPVRIDESLSPASLDSVVLAERDTRSEKYPSASPINSVECLEADQLIQDVHPTEHENDFTGTEYVPVYIKLSTGVINNFCQLADAEGVRHELSHMNSLNVDGVIVDCWWGIVESWNPQKYVWSGYRELFNIIREFKMKIQVVMAFHEYGRTGSADVLVSLPSWILEIGKENQNIFFTDREGRRTTECLSWGIDKERVLNGRTGVEVYFDFMRSFRTEFDDLFAEGLFSAVEIGLGPSGELRYPSFSERMGWRYPGIGEFQIPAVYWWYKASSHAAELTAGYYNPTNQDGYSPVFEVLKKHSVTMKFMCSGLQVCSYESDEAFADPEGLSWQVINSAWDRGLAVAGENTLSCYDREGCLRIIETAKPRNDPDRRHFSFFVYQQPSPLVQGVICFPDLDYFIKCMHGDITGELVP